MGDQQGEDWIYASDGRWYPRSAYGQQPAAKSRPLSSWTVIVVSAVLGTILTFLAFTIAGPVADGFGRGLHDGWDKHQTTTTVP